MIASPLLNARETATRLRVSEATVRRLARRGELPHLRVGSQIRVDAGELEAWLHRDVERYETSKSARQSNSPQLARTE